eukprot:g2997.t1
MSSPCSGASTDAYTDTSTDAYTDTSTHTRANTYANAGSEFGAHGRTRRRDESGRGSVWIGTARWICGRAECDGQVADWI